ncbi:MAG: hypothetical protein A2268_09235 [Candidatus Raymondbacteria bacterium RifOxyA12_full_50_37]|uniref:Uncharacterized protein n=1 Tax=Candidatus Raymondbacteria bacterium RIFOXYD12_FULL_49_13 TaxID=1817890 RepID=A0A1F7FHG8_UNCRA|nr:MAG: hypothetical protein A2268_09235 [Candidatus Raymondbacteria bacterium RifOxyA12_full_50_37]OGJ88934.1 MAG: hypothetical protein A2248_11725 [Candidatus Raymondbacteria bacterium RIFOXYA2_FULL_49_16]OGJ98889.1 MAG: hypothetical protein A2350_16330 [Candidatus Raymondbacteria bacterium RifOxyB12_full_50_8]OGJ99134.1 MAG: hypothetical protein A2487_03490 [Candidatus Raymondbacteria bacterium RifOxyC12_full_50_8]OGK05932.1 MAG: hypothetical protein A2519_04855 [Candidatus Raymondbacteria b
MSFFYLLVLAIWRGYFLDVKDNFRCKEGNARVFISKTGNRCAMQMPVETYANWKIKLPINY